MFKRWKRWVLEFCRREDGPTAMEYAVMLSLIVTVCMTAISTLGTHTNTTFKTVSKKLGSASS